MSLVTRILGAAVILGATAVAALVLDPPSADAAPSRIPEPASSFVARLYNTPGPQSVETDLGVITGVRYSFTNANQGVAISATKDGKNNLCYLQFNSVALAASHPGWTRAEPIETYREIVAAARTPGGKILCVAPPSNNGAGSIDHVAFDGTFSWVHLGGGNAGAFQITSG